MNIIAWLEIELAYYDVAVQHVNHYPSPIGWGWRIHQLHLYGEVKHSTMSVLDMTLNNLMVRLQPWRFGERGVALHCHCSQVHYDLEWKHLIGSNIWPNRIHYVCKQMTDVRLWLLHGNTWNHLIVYKKELSLI